MPDPLGVDALRHPVVSGGFTIHLIKMHPTNVGPMEPRSGVPQKPRKWLQESLFRRAG